MKKEDIWFEEKYKDILGNRYRVEKVLFKGQSKYQKIEVFETRGHGRMLVNDGFIMTSDKDEFIYHDMIAHIPLFIHPNPKTVLIIGGGDGGTAREVLRHRGVEKATMVEIDEMVVNVAREFLPITSSSLNDTRLNLIIGDGVKYLKECSEKFDLILVDSTDPIGPATPLFGKKFYKDVFRCLDHDGIVISQGESPFYNTEMQQSLLKIISECFPVSMIYNFTNLTYPGGLWSFTFASKGLHPIKDFKNKKLEASNLKFQYYNKEIHTASFMLPAFMKNNLNSFIKE